MLRSRDRRGLGERKSLEGRRDHAGGIGLLLLLHQLLTSDLKRDGKADLGRLL